MAKPQLRVGLIGTGFMGKAHVFGYATAARVFDLNMAGVDLLRSESGPKVLEVNSSPGFEGIETSTGKNITGALYDMIESRVRPAPVRRRRSADKSSG